MMLSDKGTDCQKLRSFRLSEDVLLDILRHARRSQLVSVELISQRFHRIVNRWFAAAPYLIFDLACLQNFPTDEFKEEVGRLAQSNLWHNIDFPALVCFTLNI